MIKLTNTFVLEVVCPICKARWESTEEYLCCGCPTCGSTEED